MDYLSGKPTFRIYTKADTNCSLSIRNGQVIIAGVDPYDPFQQWVKDERYSSDYKDKEGFPSFSLINKATGHQLMKHAVGASHPVQLIPYVPDMIDESTFWTLGADLGDGYRAMRMVNNIGLNLDAFPDGNGNVRDGTIVGVKEWLKGQNQLWQIVPHQEVSKNQVLDRLSRMPSVRVYTKADTSFSLAIRDGKVIVAPTNLSDPSQHWVKDEKYSTEVKDDSGFPSFRLVNKATGQAMKHSAGASLPVELIPYVPDVRDDSVGWTLVVDLSHGYGAMRMLKNTRLNLDAFHDGSIRDGTVIGLKEWFNKDNQLWQIVNVPTYQVFENLIRMPSVRVYTKAEANYSLAIRHEKVILAPTNLSDPFQHWVKDEKYSTEVKDDSGFPSFQLVNKATGQAMKHSVGPSHPVELIPYVPDVRDDSVRWTLVVDLSHGYGAMRMLKNTRLNVDAFHDGSIRDGTIIGLKEWLNKDNQLWQMVNVPTYQVFENLSRRPSVRVYTKADTNYSLAIRHGNVILAPTNLSDPFQHWVKDEKYSTEVKDDSGFPSFQLVNKATGQAMKHSIGASHPVELIPYVPDVRDDSVLWSLVVDSGHGYGAMRMVKNTRLNVDAFHDGSISDGTIIGLKEWLNKDNQLWKIVAY